MDILIKVLLPLALAVIMFALGLGLTLSDFKKVISGPAAFMTGAVSQLVLLPLAAFLIVTLFRLPPDLALGLMILSLCPGGPTSNALSRFARGDVALSVSLTAVTSLVAVVTVPVLTGWMFGWFGRSELPPANVTSLALTMFMLTVVPVAAGMFVRHAFSANRMIETVFNRLAVALFILIVFGALAANWNLFTSTFSVLGPAVVSLLVLMLTIGLIVARLAGLSKAQGSTIAIDTGIQNGTLGIAIGSLLLGTADDPLPAVSMPSALYGITMYAVAVPFAYWRRQVAG